MFGSKPPTAPTPRPSTSNFNVTVPIGKPAATTPVSTYSSISAHRTHPAGVGRRAVATVDHSGGAGAAHAAAAADRACVPGRLVDRACGADGHLRRVVDPG